VQLVPVSIHCRDWHHPGSEHCFCSSVLRPPNRSYGVLSLLRSKVVLLLTLKLDAVPGREEALGGARAQGGDSTSKSTCLSYSAQMLHTEHGITSLVSHLSSRSTSGPVHCCARYKLVKRLIVGHGGYVISCSIK
jgi:hypothetical protein